MTVPAPKFEVGRLRVKDVPESRVAGVARAGKHGEMSMNLTREHHPVAVVGKEGVFHLVEGLEVGRPRHADCRAMVAVAPCDIVPVPYPADSRVVAIDQFRYLRVGSAEIHVLLTDVPFEAIDGKTGMKPHTAVGVVAAEYSGEIVAVLFEGHYGRVKDGVRGAQLVAADDGISVAAPHHLPAPLGSVLPGDVREWFSRYSYFLGFHIFMFCSVTSVIVAPVFIKTFPAIKISHFVRNDMSRPMKWRASLNLNRRSPCRRDE